MVDGRIIIGFIFGLLCGMILMAGVARKAFDEKWNESYELGFRHGEELEKIRQANERKEKLLFESPEEVSE